MGFQINNNVAAFNAYRNLSVTQNSVSSSLEKLSSGLRINRAADDAAGLAISEGLRSQVGGLKVAARNAQDGISMVQTAEGALGTTHSMLQRLRDLSVQAANDTNSDKARTNIDTEAKQLVAELDRIGKSTSFNGTNLLDGTATSVNFQVGANSDATVNAIVVDLSSASVTGVATALGGLDFSDAAGAQAAIGTIDTQIETISTARANLGAVQNRFESTIKNLNVSIENLTASESRIRDTDMASEMVSFTKSQILSQAGTAMLAQANQMGQGVLSLLR
ncbi:flagellin [Pseudokineococcus sp. 5B2Z-1]|uniref:flagellin N-terminal helical domain-containing protein n=1 Tax=Pseudokineococcus sp. 5B2Z-1 TaxID=3132744 RepID=UPI00309CDB11